ncbi:MAG: hypothetical protein B7Z35_00345 [Hydrogenophilales bacterium 12-61-10]|nr:MAG: hypothetical protein B7Z35_00345 [Hydrogenophilales bacterium 12-61-10]OYX28374.1 MAG: hypothetical protein B7Z03_11720 [Hydrogenophilales bacterium 32-62-9]
MYLPDGAKKHKYDADHESVPDALGTAYNRTKFLKERRAMVTAWADYLDQPKAGADVIQLHQSA